MNLNENIANLAKEALSNESHFIVDLVISSKQGPGKITAVLDGDQGITIDDCAQFSRKLNKSLEEIGDESALEVTTPGVDQPLKLKRQYNKNIGRSIKVQRHDKTSETGKLVNITEESIDLDVDDKDGKHKVVKRITIPFSEIERTTVQVSFK